MAAFSMNDKGLSLVELLVALALAGIIMAAIVSAYQIQVKGKNVQEITIDMNQAVRAATEIMESEIRMAGCNPTGGAANAGIIVADTAELQFAMDINDDLNNRISDGDTGDFNETVRYALDNDDDGDGIADSTPCDLSRDTGGGLQPLAENIDGLNFVYLTDDNDGDGNPDVLSPTPLSAADRADVRMIQVTVVARSGERIRGFTGDYSDTDTYENQWALGDAVYWVLDPDEDLNDPDAAGFRRIRLTKTIHCRNMR